MTWQKMILRGGKIGFAAGLAAVFTDLLLGAWFDGTIFRVILNCISIFFAYPFIFLISFVEEVMQNYLGGLIGFILAGCLGGLVYGCVTGGIIAVVCYFRKKCVKI